MTSEMPYLLRKNGMWYAHNDCGYTARAELAEIYTKEHAIKYASHCDEVSAVPLDSVISDPDALTPYIYRMRKMQAALRYRDFESLVETKEGRLQLVNDLIKIIGSHGRRFFYYAEADRYSRMELRKGRIWWIDAYREDEVYLMRTGLGSRWRGFTNGGTLRSLVEDMRDYIRSGRPIPFWKLACKRDGESSYKDNIWGYSEFEANFMVEKASRLPIFDRESRL